jgi:hypothetical protein
MHNPLELPEDLGGGLDPYFEWIANVPDPVADALIYAGEDIGEVYAEMEDDTDIDVETIHEYGLHLIHVANLLVEYRRWKEHNGSPE